MEHEVVQLKLTCGSEIVCQVIEWPEPNDNQMIVRNALSIINFDTEDNDRVYMFVPWLHFAEGEKDYVVINSDHVMASSKPNSYLRDQYKIAVLETNTASKQREEDHRRRKEEGIKKLEEAMSRVLDQDAKETKLDTANVLKFPGPSNDDTIH